MVIVFFLFYFVSSTIILNALCPHVWLYCIFKLSYKCKKKLQILICVNVFSSAYSVTPTDQNYVEFTQIFAYWLLLEDFDCEKSHFQSVYWTFIFHCTAQPMDCTPIKWGIRLLSDTRRTKLLEFTQILVF